MTCIKGFTLIYKASLASVQVLRTPLATWPEGT
jgi:hypothetical protein